MKKRKREIQLKFYVTEKEERLIKRKMDQIGFSCFGAFARKMLLNGLVVNPVVPDLDKALIVMSKAGNNINQITRRINAKQSAEMKEIQNVKNEIREIWLALKSIEESVHVNGR